MHRDQDDNDEKRGLIAGDEEALSFDEYVCLASCLIGALAGYLLADMSGVLLGIFGGYLVFHAFVGVMTRICSVYNRRRH